MVTFYLRPLKGKVMQRLSRNHDSSRLFFARVICSIPPSGHSTKEVTFWLVFLSDFGPEMIVISCTPFLFPDHLLVILLVKL